MPQRFADTATVLARILAALAGADRVGITTPENLTGLMPFVRASRSGGPRDRLNDYARIAVDVFDDDYERGYAMAEDIAAFLEPGRLHYGPVVLDRVSVDAGPQELPPWAPGIFRFETTYTIVSRRARVV